MAENLFNEGDSVVHRSDRGVGRISRVLGLDGGEYWYRVQFLKAVENVVEDDLELLDEVSSESIEELVLAGRWGRTTALRCALAVERIQQKNRSTVYAFQAQRILFQPYQYKPLLMLLESPDRRLLIADEVGLGKTIEAGLILTELEARKPLDRVLIVCPSRLREKWVNELNRKFNQDFEVLDSSTFLSFAERAAENPSLGRLRGVISMQSMRRPELRESLTANIGHLDMVIVDEAHHARNPDTSTSEMLRELCEVSDCAVLLTATPLHLKNQDLFTLVNALRPTEFRNPWVFDQNVDAHIPVHRAAALIRRQDPDQLNEIVAILRSVFDVNGAIRDPRAAQIVAQLEDGAPTERRAWVDLERRIQELHPLGTIVTRTRKREVIENAPERRARVVHCDWTSNEIAAYEQFVGLEGDSGWFSQPLSLGQIQRARQAASCLPAAIQSNFTSCFDDDATELIDIPPSVLQSVFLDQPRDDRATPMMKSLSDSKFLTLQQMLDHIWSEEPDAKVLVFTFFRGTAAYLEAQLASANVSVLRIDGTVRSDPNNPNLDERGKRLKAFQEDASVRVMVSTEVGSEGLDFQYCHHIVNYDLPWNPMVVEQRIGRIDRFGQESSVVHIHNLVVRGTVEDVILSRLYTRIGIFENSIGALEAILGETINELQREFVSGQLTREEADARLEQAQNAIERQQRALDELDGRASELFGHDEYIRSEMNRVRRLGRFVGDESMTALLSGYFRRHHPTVQLWNEAETGIMALRLTEELRNEILDANRGKRPWVNRSVDGVLRVTTTGDIAFHNPEIDLLNVFHPLVISAVRKMQEQLQSPLERTAHVCLNFATGADVEVEAGEYFVLVFAHSIDSLRSRRILETVAYRVSTRSILDPDDGERLLFLITKSGSEWYGTEPSLMKQDVWDLMTKTAFERNRSIHRSESTENEALFVRKRNAVEAEHRHHIDIKRSRLESAERNGKVRIIPAMQGQVAKAESEYRTAIQNLTRNQTVRTSLSDPIAACVVRVTTGEEINV